MWASDFADEMNRKVHNARIETKRAEATISRARRCVNVQRATIASERARASEAIEALRNFVRLYESSAERGLVMAPGFVEMHIRNAIRTLGGDL